MTYYLLYIDFFQESLDKLQFWNHCEHHFSDKKIFGHLWLAQVQAECAQAVEMTLKRLEVGGPKGGQEWQCNTAQPEDIGNMM